ncbi:GNAT family N-acetyltransferase [Streptomyces zagrosensis]|uniref:RimJ/RimL family protein N-acetyltransferase n=1 Tax=Streptomyces zagrosensis TaxID=1042984 RepID=A0A7W9UXY3_9ACTN|nr:GNAT family N-acetyltransferase [Streptomyces zagrosensis]MBB5934816.1 RimJ/RimL family protein N-acetyltransferase [Streptomyces zagrosensis]
MLTDHWPLAGLRVATPRLELRLPDDDELAALADVAAEGVHQPGQMPFSVPWTDAPGPERARSVVQYHWLLRGNWTPADWSLNLVVFQNGDPLGVQELAARDFAVLHAVSTGSWLGLKHQGRGIGTEMRTAILHLAFAGLGAREAVTSAFEDNARSYGVSRKLGYAPDGVQRVVSQGRPATLRRLRLLRAHWRPSDGVPVTITGLDPCRPLFGLDAA